MSSYRSYRPWNSSLSSYSSSTSNYRSRYGNDGTSSLSSSSASSAKFSSITPSSYRPSYSSTSGTYRASRAPSVSTTSTTPSYTRTYSNLGKTTDDDKEKSSKTTPSYSRAYTSLGKSSTDDDKDKSSKASTPNYSRAYTSLGKSNTDDDKDKPTKTYTRTYTSTLSKTNHENEKEKEKKEPSPPKRTTSRLSVKDLSAETKSRLSTAYTTTPAKKEEKGPPITFNTRYKQTSSTRGRSRDPSPAADTTSGQTALQRISAQRSRDPSPSISAYSRLSTARSRDPSPVSKSYTDSTVDKSSLSRASVDRNPINRTYSNNLHVNSNKSPSDKSLNRTLSNSLSSTLEKLDREIKTTIRNEREKSRDPSPLNTRRPSITSITSSYPRSRDPSPVSDNKYLLSSYRITNGKDNKSREPSPSITLSKPKLRETSPSITSISNYRRPSREPSPVESLSKYGSTTSGFSTTSTYNRPSYREPSPQIKLPDIGLSYMTASESSAANAARASRISFINRHSPQKDVTPPKVAIPVISKKQESESESSETSSSEEESTDSSSEESEEEVRKPEPKIMIQVSTITRGTSPNPPGQTPRTSRRVEVAKTIEKVRERPLNNPPMLDKATQSDRMDDSTRYSKYASTIRSPYSPYSPSPTSYSSRYTSGLTSSRYTREQSEVSNADTEKSETSQKSDKFNFALSKSKEGSPVKSDTSRSSSLMKSPSPSKICVSKDRNRTSSLSSAKSKTPESSKALPPQSPKAESPPKMSSPKVTNKDFRKSALNMGPTDRQTRSKSSSSDNSSPTVEKTRQQFQKMLNGEQKEEIQRRSIERSVSVESDTSTESTESVEMQSQIQQPQFELSKEEKITAKVEEAKNFLLKTLGNPTFNQVRKSPTPETWVEESSSAIPETEYSQSTNFTKDEVLTTQPTKEEKKPWWAIDDTADDASAIENDITITSGVGTTLQQDNSNQIVNGFSEMTLNPTENQSENFTSKWSLNEIQSLKSIQRVDSGDRPWWCSSPENKVAASENQAIAQNNENTAVSNMWEQETQADVSEIQKDDEIQEITKNLQQCFDANALGDRASPEGLEDRRSPYDNVMQQQQQQSINNVAYRIENDFNARPRLFISRHTNIDDLLGGHSVFSPTAMDRPYLEMITPDLVRIHDSNSPPKIVLNKNKSAATATAENDHQQVGALPQKLDDAAIQVYKDGDFGAYLDLESSLAEQSEEIEGLNTSRKNSLVVRTQLSVRVHTIIEKLLTSEGRELRRALFSLKQIFQEDKDLVHGFVGLGGLNCLVQIGSEADQNYQNYILRALGQVMLYVDGMNGVMKHGPTVQWLYTLIASKYRLVVKTALKLLLVFVEYCEGNCYLLVNAIRTVDSARGSLPWTNIMKLLKDYDNADTELLIYATSLINKTLSGLSDQDSFYDESDFLEQQGMESIIQRYMSRTGTDLDLLDQFQLYEAALRFEDGESDEIIRLPDNTVRKTLRLRSSDSTERRKSRRHSTGTAPPPAPPPIPTYNIVPPVVPPLPLNYMIQQQQQQKKEQQDDDNDDSSSSGGGGDLNGFADCKVREGVAGVTPGLRRRRERAERQKSFQREQEAVVNGTTKNGGVESDDYDTENEDKKLLQQLKREQTVKDLTQKLSNLPLSPQEEKPNRVGDMSGLISKAKEELNKSKNKVDVKTNVENDLKKPEPKKSEIELHWEELMKNMDRDLILCDLDFRDLNEEDEINVLTPRGINGSSIPPPPPAMMVGLNNPLGNLVPPPMLRPNGLVNGNSPKDSSNNDLNGLTLKKTKKTVKLFWKEVREDMIPTTIERTIWDELPPSNVDTLKLEHLFESRAKDLLTKKQQEINKNKEIIVLDHKRSNAINIAMTKLPPPRAIKAAILKMDSTVVTREGIEKLLNMLPTDEERGKIQEAQMLSPELPLGSAEQFLLTLSSISELPARLKLWAFKLDFENLEKEIAEPLMDLKQGVELLKTNLTFKCILSTLLSIGCFLNGQPVKGFQIEYLAKVPEVKDTVHKHSLLHHLCHMVMESQSNTTDLYSEIGPITRASKADFNELAHNIKYLETECKASWDRLKLISKHDTAPQLKQKLIDFLADCAERIIILDVVHRRVINRYHKFLLWLGVPPHRIAESRPNEFCRILSEFALEYRTTRERVHQQIEKKANHRERNKTRGKLIIDVPKFKNGNVVPATKEENSKDEELRQLLGTTDGSETAEINGTFTFRRRRPETQRSPSVTARDESFTDADDEIFESLVKTVTKTATPRPVQRERKRTRNADRKSLVKRSRTREGFAAQRSPSPV